MKLPKPKTEWEVEFKSLTYRQVTVEAEDEDEAYDLAFEAIYEDEEISRSWAESAEIDYLRKKSQ